MLYPTELRARPTPWRPGGYLTESAIATTDGSSDALVLATRRVRRTSRCGATAYLPPNERFRRAGLRLGPITGCDSSPDDLLRRTSTAASLQRTANPDAGETGPRFADQVRLRYPSAAVVGSSSRSSVIGRQMHAKTVITIVSVILASLGWADGSFVQTFCADSGERGFASSPQLACWQVDCHTSEPSDGDCAEEDCCAFDEVPTQPFAPQAAPHSLGEAASVCDGLLPAKLLAKKHDAPLRGPARGGSPRETDSAAFPGYPLPLLI